MGAHEAFRWSLFVSVGVDVGGQAKRLEEERKEKDSKHRLEYVTCRGLL